MRAVSAGAVWSNKLLWWESLVDASECWIKKSLCGSLPVAVNYDTVCCAQVPAISNAVFLADNRDTDLRADSNETCTDFVIHMRKLLRDVCEGVRDVSICGRMHEGAIPSIKVSHPFTKGAAWGYKRLLPYAKCMSLDPMPAHGGLPNNGFSLVELSKKIQEAFEITSSSRCPENLPHEGKNLEGKTRISFRTQSYQGLSNDAFQVWKAQAFNENKKHFLGSAYLSGSFRCPQEILGSRHALPLTSFGRALSTSSEKQFDEDVAEQQSSVPSPQQASLGGQQSSLEVPDSKPVGGPSWPNPDNAASYVLMSNIYADGDRWDEVKRINEMRLKARAWKKPGKAYVEIQAKVHEFIVGDRTHQDSTNIYEKLRKIKRHMGHIGYVPYVDLVLENRSYYDPYKPR